MELFVSGIIRDCLWQICQQAVYSKVLDQMVYMMGYALYPLWGKPHQMNSRAYQYHTKKKCTIPTTSIKISSTDPVECARPRYHLDQMLMWSK